MNAENLTKLQTHELIDLLWLPKRISSADEEILVLAELGARHLTPKQKALVRRLMPVSRRQYDYRATSQNDTA
ncbi:MAG: hypothetical protein WC544_01455 [Patescibacteria group bacterium]